jgi:colanic acid/amylovoran biosynthesis glycosyltransferase
MRITICAFDAPNNIDGPTAWMKRVLPFLRNNGVEVRILYFAAHHKELPAYNHFVKEGYACKIIYWEIFQEQKIIDILEDIKNFPPDIFIPNYFPFAFYAARWVIAAGIPTVMILHNDDPFHHALVEEYACKKDGLDVTAVVGVSKLITQMIEERAPHHEGIYCIPYGAPIPANTTKSPAGKDLQLVYAGRIVEPQKRISEVTKAFCRVAQEIPGTSCTIYGSGRAEAAVKTIIQTEGKGLNVTYRGKLENSVVQQHLLQNHIFVLLSDYEGIPISLMEAMGCGLVPVCSNIRSGMTELIENGVNGILVNDRNDSFVAAIKMLKENPGTWEKMSMAAREKITKEYAEEVCNKKWLSLLKSLHANAGTKKPLQMPSSAALQHFSSRKEFGEYYNPRPFFLFIPFYYAKKFAGRMKRKLFNQAY